MIEKNVNIIHDLKIKRIVEYSEGDKQVNVLDQRFYRRNGEYYPSVTSVLNYFPKNHFFQTWLKDVGHNADVIASKAAGEGTQVHNAIESFLKGNEIQWINEYGEAQYNLDVWKMILKFADFWNTHKPELITTEYHLFSDAHKYAGTADLVIKINNQLWLVDIKTSNSLHTSHNLQLAAYAMAWNETHDSLIERTGILWLKASTRGEGKGDNIQGKGWQLKAIDDIGTNFAMFKNVYELYKLENPDFKPMTELLPTSVKISE